MATLTLTVAAGGNAGASFRKLGKTIERAVAEIPDVNATGASTVLTLDNGSGVCTVQVTAGPYTSTTVYRV